MSQIFQKPPQPVTGALKTLFLHGLEGSPDGKKASMLKQKWGAMVPTLRTIKLREIKNSLGNRSWSEFSKNKIDKAIQDPYSDAKDAVRYLKPDIVVGSSMGRC